MSTRLDQDRRDLQMAVDRGKLQAGSAVLVDLVGVFPAADQPAHLGRIVVGCGARDIVEIGAEQAQIGARAPRRQEEHEHRAAQEPAREPGREPG